MTKRMIRRMKNWRTTCPSYVGPALSLGTPASRRHLRAKLALRSQRDAGVPREATLASSEPAGRRRAQGRWSLRLRPFS